MAINQTQKNLLKESLDFISIKNNLVTPHLKDLYLFTINHKTAPIPIREKFAIPEYTLTDANQKLKDSSLKSFLILSTCNRTEIYFTSSNLEKALRDIYNFFESHLQIEEKITKEYNLISNDNAVISHAFKLACGLESLVVGERQILSQIKAAYSIAQKEKTLGSTLELLFQNVIKCAKEIHKKTNLSKNSQSISSAAVDLANKVCGPIKNKSVMVLGAGNMAKLALEQILKIGGSKETVVLNKSPHRIIEFPEKYKTDRSFPFENIYEVMNDVDILIAATGAPHFIVFAEQFSKVRKDTSKLLYIFDISMPRNIDSELGKLPNIKLFDIDSLQVIYNQTTQVQKEDLNEAEKIIIENTHDFLEKVTSEKIDDLIKDLKEKVEKIRFEKLKANVTGKTTLTKEEVDYITKNIVNTILHIPISILKESNISSNNEKIATIKELFQL